MPLSKDEQRRFDEIERALREDDPRFAAGTGLDQLRRRRTSVAAGGFLLGPLLVFAGLVATQTQVAVGVIISVAGFPVMLAAAGRLVVVTPRPRGRKRSRPPHG